MKAHALALGLALAAGRAVRADTCAQYPDCASCLNPPDASLDCGWCSPDPALWADGTPATQCMDHTSKGWNCFHFYMHDGCVAGCAPLGAERARAKELRKREREAARAGGGAGRPAASRGDAPARARSARRRVALFR